MKRLWFKLKLRGKFRLLSLIGLLIWLSNFSIIYFEIHGINQATLDLENFEELYNTVLEARRYEKNFLLYQDRADFNETLNQFNHSRHMLDRLPFNAGLGNRSNARENLQSALEDYGRMLSILGKTQWVKPISTAT